MLDKLDAEKNLKGEDKDKIKDRVAVHPQRTLRREQGHRQGRQATRRHSSSGTRTAATYKNDLGFIWCDNDMNLEESEKLIKEALDLDKKEQEKAKEEGKIDEVKENAAYLDSLGWVLFKQKKYKEALEPLKKASQDEDEGNHLEIWDHLADCLHGARAEEGSRSPRGRRR